MGQLLGKFESNGEPFVVGGNMAMLIQAVDRDLTLYLRINFFDMCPVQRVGRDPRQAPKGAIRPYRAQMGGTDESVIRWLRLLSKMADGSYPDIPHSFSVYSGSVTDSASETAFPTAFHQTARNTRRQIGSNGENHSPSPRRRHGPANAGLATAPVPDPAANHVDSASD